MPVCRRDARVRMWSRVEKAAFGSRVDYRDKRADSTWDEGTAGKITWTDKDDDGLTAGDYELVLYVDGKERRRGNFTVK